MKVCVLAAGALPADNQFLAGACLFAVLVASKVVDSPGAGALPHQQSARLRCAAVAVRESLRDANKLSELAGAGWWAGTLRHRRLPDEQGSLRVWQNCLGVQLHASCCRSVCRVQLLHACTASWCKGLSSSSSALLETASAGVAVAGVLAVLHCCLDLKATIGGRHPAALFYLAAAMRPRMLMTVDEAGDLLAVPVRVGQAVDVVAQARSFVRRDLCCGKSGQSGTPDKQSLNLASNDLWEN